MNGEINTLEKAPKDEFLALVEKIIENPEVSAEKLEVLVNLQIKLEDRRAKKQYDAAMIKVRPLIKAVAWDKIGAHNSRYASYPKIDEMLTPILDEHGLAISFDTEPDARPNMMIGCCDVMHIGGHTKRHRLPMPIDGSGPRDAGVMTGQQAVKSGVSYFIRTFVGMIFAIPMLVDKDDNDGNAIRSTVSEPQAKVLRDLFDRLSEATRLKVLEYLSNTYKQEIKAVKDIPSGRYKHAETTLARALNGEGKDKAQSAPALVNEIQVVTLQGAIEGIGKTCKPDFLAAFKIKKIGDLPADKYPDALKWIEQQRGK